MSDKIIVPTLGESVTEATVSKWLKSQGDSVSADEPIVELETDKVNLEVPSPVTGVLSQINFKNGATVEVGVSLGSVSKNGAENTEKNEIKKIDETLKVNNVVNLETPKKEPQIFDKEPEKEQSASEPLVLINEIKEEKILEKNPKNKVLSPAVRKIATENKIDIQSIIID